jgi:hypothetical protein
VLNFVGKPRICSVKTTEKTLGISRPPGGGVICAQNAAILDGFVSLTPTFLGKPTMILVVLVEHQGCHVLATHTPTCRQELSSNNVFDLSEFINQNSGRGSDDTA